MRLLVRIAAALAASMAASFSPVSAEWLRASNSHFTIYGDMTPNRLKQFADRLERFDAALRFVTKARETTPVTIYVVSDVDEVQRLSGRRGVFGFYRPQAQEPFVITPLATGTRHTFSLSAEDVLLHEYAHHMLLSNNDQFLPAWANEGMAEFFMSADFQPDGGIVFGAPNTSRFFSITSVSRWTAKQLLMSEMRSVPANQIDQRYSRGWLLVHYLLLSGERGNQYSQYIEKLNEGVAVDKAAVQVFGDLDKLDGDLQRYLRRTRFQGLRLTPDQLKTTVPVTVTKLSPGAAAFMPYRIRSANGVTPAGARVLADAARPIAARYPGDALVQRALAEMEYDAGRLDATIAAADLAIAADPANVMAMVYKGRVFARRAEEANDEQLWKEARSWFLKANRADPNHAMPFVSFYDSFIAAGEKPSKGAETGLLRAINLVPQDESLHTRVGLMKLRQNDPKGARAILGVVAFAPHSTGQNPARDAVNMIDEGASPKAILAKVESKLTVSDFAGQEAPEAGRSKAGDEAKDGKD